VEVGVAVEVVVKVKEGVGVRVGVAVFVNVGVGVGVGVLHKMLQEAARTFAQKVVLTASSAWARFQVTWEGPLVGTPV
jgi:hypothetical protein